MKLVPRPISSFIPRIIHQVYSNDNLPIKISDNIGHLRELNPQWEYRFYNDLKMGSYIKSHFPGLITYYNRIAPAYGAARADFFRYLVMYREGGVYLDIKSSGSKPFSDVLRDDDIFYLSHWPNGLGQTYEGWGIHNELSSAKGEFQQWFIAGVSGHPFLHCVITAICNNIDSYDKYRDQVGRAAVLNVTGPIAYTKAILPVINQYPYRLVDSSDDLGLIYSIFENGSGVGHHHIYRRHYSKLRSGLVLNGDRKKILPYIGLKLRIFLQSIR
ncbi:glycosyltransferase family 32 protein [Desulfosediminicola ganghwensis]|uniref:glycosyltransferase family 32 protein n=1 Tax=Desulfosediminicola ganghwensis TaxID=2569540 RepID=UPI0010AD8A6D|nr:glycosyltransferase [Desulfosediminicola ganghwensis]